jgi:hypothetical protein
VPRDTNPEVAALLHERMKAMTPTERAERMLDWCHEVNMIRFNRLQAVHPGAPHSEIIALWTEETWQGRLDPGLLARACEAIRERGRREGN